MIGDDWRQKFGSDRGADKPTVTHEILPWSEITWVAVSQPFLGKQVRGQFSAGGFIQ